MRQILFDIKGGQYRWMSIEAQWGRYCLTSNEANTVECQLRPNEADTVWRQMRPILFDVKWGPMRQMLFDVKIRQILFNVKWGPISYILFDIKWSQWAKEGEGLSLPFSAPLALFAPLNLSCLSRLSRPLPINHVMSLSQSEEWPQNRLLSCYGYLRCNYRSNISCTPTCACANFSELYFSVHARTKIGCSSQWMRAHNWEVLACMHVFPRTHTLVWMRHKTIILYRSKLGPSRFAHCWSFST